jgi:hypothetical protein
LPLFREKAVFKGGKLFRHAFALKPGEAHRVEKRRDFI